MLGASSGAKFACHCKTNILMHDNRITVGGRGGGKHRPQLVKLCQHLMFRWLEITFSQSECPMPFESAVYVDQVYLQMKVSSTSPRLIWS